MLCIKIREHVQCDIEGARIGHKESLMQDGNKLGIHEDVRVSVKVILGPEALNGSVVCFCTAVPSGRRDESICADYGKRSCKSGRFEQFQPQKWSKTNPESTENLNYVGHHPSLWTGPSLQNEYLGRIVL